MDKSYIFLKSPIGSGGEADIYTVRIRPELVAKVYKKPHGDYARKLARAVRSVHSRGYVIGDVNESNVLVADDAIVTLVDTDSFQVNDGTTIYRCTVGKPEYTPPELQGMSFRDVDRSVQHDLFGLGVLIYQLLMEGTHPFGGVFSGQGEAPELKDRIKRRDISPTVGAGFLISRCLWLLLFLCYLWLCRSFFYFVLSRDMAILRHVLRRMFGVRLWARLRMVW
ncbi:MAG: hypothetical protein AUK48_12680 [Oscillatoriales cyanobacterium CG2_30_44_21]|nr:MAG: hypothetical protein AUK48_12680 [Oscillatoriales cyanobacterium CG2_30_44_21]